MNLWKNALDKWGEKLYNKKEGTYCKRSLPYKFRRKIVALIGGVGRLFPFEDFYDYVDYKTDNACYKYSYLKKLIPCYIVVHIDHSLPGAGLTAYRLVRSFYYYTLLDL